MATDYYGSPAPKGAHGAANFESPTSSSRIITNAVERLYDSLVSPNLLVRRLNVTVNGVVPAASVQAGPLQLDLFADPDKVNRERE